MPVQEKILIVRVGLGGDLVMITPAMRLLLDAFPGAEFHLLSTGEGRRVMGDFSEQITKTWLYHRRFPQTLLLQRKLKSSFQKEGYTRIYVFEHRSLYRSWLEDLAPDFHGLDNQPNTGHFSQQCLSLVDKSLTNLGKDIPPHGWISLPYTEKGLNEARSLLGEHVLQTSTKLVGLHPTFSGSSFSFFKDRKGARHRTWPTAHFAMLGRLLKIQAAEKGIDLAVVIDALPEERPIIDPLIAQSDNSIILMTSAPDFQRYKGYLKTLDLLVTPNTGPMHFASALGTKVLGLFSGWSADDCGPYVPANQYEVLHTDDEKGLAGITAEMVADAVWRNL